MIRAKWAVKFKEDHPDMKIRLNTIDSFIASFGYSKAIRKHIRGLESVIPILYSGCKFGVSEEQVIRTLDEMTRVTPPKREYVLLPFPSEITYISNKINLRKAYITCRKEEEENANGIY